MKKSQKKNNLTLYVKKKIIKQTTNYNFLKNLFYLY